MATLTETREKFAAKQNQMAEVITAAKTTSGELDFAKVDAHGFKGLDSAAAVERIKSMNDELSDLSKTLDGLTAAQRIADAQSGRDDFDGGEKNRSTSQLLTPESAKTRSVGEAITGSKGFDAFARMNGREIELDLAKDIGGGSLYGGVKTLMETGAGWAPEAIRSGRLVDSAQRPPQMTDLIPSETTNQNAVVYMEETTWTNNAAETLEGGSYGEAALAYTERNSPVQKITVFIPVTDEQLEDVPQLSAMINNRLGAMVYQRLDTQIAVGDGTSPNLSGFLDRAIQTYAKGTDDAGESALDAIFRARTKVRVTGRAVPTAVVIHGNDFQDIRLMRTADGIYILGNPTEAGPERLWGLRVVENEGITEGTALVGDFAAHSGLAIKKNLTFKVSDSHSDYFVKGKQAIRCDMRAALQVYRLSAFCSVSGL